MKSTKKMDLQSKKIDLAQDILSLQREALVDKLKAIIEKEKIVGYTTDGQPLTKEAYNARLEKAEEDIVNGRVTSSDDLKKEIKNWKR